MSEQRCVRRMKHLPEQRTALGSTLRLVERPRSRWVTYLLVAVGCAVLAYPVLAADPLDDYKLAVGLYNKGRWKLAAETFEGFLKAAPEHPNAERAEYYLGLTYFNAEDYPKARDTLRAFAKKYPASPRKLESAYWTGYASFLANDFAAADLELAEFVKGAPEDPLLERALPMLGECAYRGKKFDGAVELFQRSLKSHPNGVLAEDAKFGLARAFEGLKKHPEALALYAELAANPTGVRAAEAQLSVGIRHYDDARYAEATQAFKALATNFPTSTFLPLGHLNHGFALYQLGRFAEASQEFEAAAKDPKYAADGRLWSGFSWKGAGDFAKASAVFADGLKVAGEGPVAEKFLHHQADSEQRQGNAAVAKKLHLEVVQRFPTGSLAESSLMAAAMCAVLEKAYDEVDVLLARLDKEYPANKAKDRAAVLRGRVAIERNQPEAAVAPLTAALGSPDPLLQAEARYVLASAQQRLGKHAEVVALTEPVVDELSKGQLSVEFLDAWLVRGTSQLALARSLPRDPPGPRGEQLSGVVASADGYLKVGGERAATAMALKSLALVEAGRAADADPVLAQLREKFAGRPEVSRADYEAGEAAFNLADFAWAERAFTRVAASPQGDPFRSRAMLEKAWSIHKQKRFDEAAAAFGAFATEYPEDKLCAEAACMRATALQDAGKTAEALPLFQQVFDKYGTSDQAYVAGLQLARLTAKQGKIEQSNAAYAAVADRFQDRPEMDQLLDEWATVNYEAQNYVKADEVFQLLMKRFPDSPLADNARLVLAEGRLVNGDIAGARGEFQGLAADAKSDEIVKQRAAYQLLRILAVEKNWAAAKASAAALLEQYPAGKWRADIEFTGGEAAYELGEYEAARDRFLALKSRAAEGAVANSDWFARMWVLLAESYFRLKDYAGVETLAKEYAGQPGVKNLYQVEEVRGRSLKAQAKFPEARAIFQKVVEDPNGRLTETAARCQFEVAESFLFEKNYDSAVKAYLTTEIRYKFPKWQGLALYQAGTCHEALGEWAEAARTYDNLLQTYADHEMAPKARERLAEVRKKL
jgi:cellulose synthase operon protein C